MVTLPAPCDTGLDDSCIKQIAHDDTSMMAGAAQLKQE